MSNDRDEESWRTRLTRHGPALVLLARQYCQRQADAEDAVQDGFIRFWRSRERAQDATAYLFACVRSAAMDLSRGRRRREQHHGEGPEPSLEIDPAAGVEHEELRGAVEDAMRTLPDEQREVLVMKIWGELTFVQIAAALAINPDTAASRYRYALARLESALRQEAGHE